MHPALAVAVNDRRPRVARSSPAQASASNASTKRSTSAGAGASSRDHATTPRRVPVLEGEPVGNRRDLARIAPQDFGRRTLLPRRVPLRGEVRRRRGRRARAPRQELDVHQDRRPDRAQVPQRQLYRRKVAAYLHGVDRRLVLVRPPRDLVEVPDARSFRVRARSTPYPRSGTPSAAVGVHTPVRAMACRNRAEDETPAARRLRPPRRELGFSCDPLAT